MKNWELCPKCNGDKILVVNVYGGCECPMCNGSGLISSFNGKPPEWSYNKAVTTYTTGNINLTIKSTTA